MTRSTVIISLFCLLSMISQRSEAHDTHGRTHAERDEHPFEFQFDAFAGRRGYQHFGASFAYSLDDDSRVGLGSHSVREETGAETFPSLGVEYSRAFDQGFHAEIFSFLYFPVEGQRAVALGTRISKTFKFRDSEIVPFAGGTLAKVRAISEKTENPRGINHLMLLGGVSWRFRTLEASLFASHSLYSARPRALETRVDLEEMTHLTVYGNNDGFPYTSGGLELGWSVTSRFALNAHYAAMHFDDLKTRHSALFTGNFDLTDNWTLFAGVQLLRGGDRDNELLTTGIFVRF